MSFVINFFLNTCSSIKYINFVSASGDEVRILNDLPLSKFELYNHDHNSKLHDKALEAEAVIRDR